MWTPMRSKPMQTCDHVRHTLETGREICVHRETSSLLNSKHSAPRMSSQAVITTAPHTTRATFSLLLLSLSMFCSVLCCCFLSDDLKLDFEGSHQRKTSMQSLPSSRLAHVHPLFFFLVCQLKVSNKHQPVPQADDAPSYATVSSVPDPVVPAARSSDSTSWMA